MIIQPLHGGINTSSSTLSMFICSVIFVCHHQRFVIQPFDITQHLSNELQITFYFLQKYEKSATRKESLKKIYKSVNETEAQLVSLFPPDVASPLCLRSALEAVQKYADEAESCVKKVAKKKYEAPKASKAFGICESKLDSNLIEIVNQTGSCSKHGSLRNTFGSDKDNKFENFVNISIVVA